MAIRVGISLSEYDEMTPHELNIHIEEFYAAKESEAKDKITLAYLTAHLQRVNKMPSLKKLLQAKSPPKEPQTDEQILATIRALNMAFGGKEVNKKTDQ